MFAGRPEKRQDSGHVTPSKASAKASSQQSATAADAAREELASVRREAAAAKEASAAEVSLMRRQLASAQSAAADAEAALADAEKVMPQHNCLSLREDRKERLPSHDQLATT